MKDAGRITGEALLAAREAVRPGVSTWELDRVVHDYITRAGAIPSFLGYDGFPASACISINEEVIHGIPSKKRVLREGDLVKLDVGAYYKGFHGDSARTIPVGKVSEDALRLIRATRESFFAGLAAARPGNRVGDIGAAIDGVIVSYGYGTVRRYVGHGVGEKLHEEPEIPNFGMAGHGPRLYAGMTVAIEPMVNAGTPDVIDQSDGWTVITADHSLSAHYENSVALTDEGVINLTLVDPEF